MTSYKFDVTPEQYDIAVDALTKNGFAEYHKGGNKSIVLFEDLEWGSSSSRASDLPDTWECITFDEFMERWGKPEIDDILSGPGRESGWVSNEDAEAVAIDPYKLFTEPTDQDFLTDLSLEVAQRAGYMLDSTPEEYRQYMEVYANNRPPVEEWWDLEVMFGKAGQNWVAACERDGKPDEVEPEQEPVREANIPDLPDNEFSPRIGWLR